MSDQVHVFCAFLLNFTADNLIDNDGSFFYIPKVEVHNTYAEAVAPAPGVSGDKNCSSTPV